MVAVQQHAWCLTSGADKCCAVCHFPCLSAVSTSNSTLRCSASCRMNKYASSAYGSSCKQEHMHVRMIAIHAGCDLHGISDDDRWKLTATGRPSRPIAEPRCGALTPLGQKSTVTPSFGTVICTDKISYLKQNTFYHDGKRENTQTCHEGVKAAEDRRQWGSDTCSTPSDGVLRAQTRQYRQPCQCAGRRAAAASPCKQQALRHALAIGGFEAGSTLCQTLHERQST